MKGLSGLVDVWDHREKFDKVENNILDCFQYFQKEVKEVQKEERAMRNLKDDYDVVGADWNGGYLKEDLVEVAEARTRLIGILM